MGLYMKYVINNKFWFSIDVREECENKDVKLLVVIYCNIKFLFKRIGMISRNMYIVYVMFE